ncbi:hypothetical protein NE236_41445 [Actinoallomurus purpureus]|uniref:hypothetical protein n=1 Tax=Actinoallomurus purpureus TaxID=478114 RepID=UPI0020928097|nr:hypothetical protein [Actinoallomurus purpureus]MCO6011434.1 hypothetical protein [Actinoallomurus purpureus]
MPPTIDAVLADGVLIPVTCDDHLVRQVAGRWVCIRPRHADRPCSIQLALAPAAVPLSA